MILSIKEFPYEVRLIKETGTVVSGRPTYKSRSHQSIQDYTWIIHSSTSAHFSKIGLLHMKQQEDIH